MAFVRKDGVDQARVRYRRCDGEFQHTTLDRVVVDDMASGLPVREFRWYKGRRHYSGWYYSSTVEGLVVYESRLELARIMLADFDRDVIALAAQPFQLAGPDGAGIRRHVPDILLVNADGSVMVVDVKAPSKVEVLKAPNRRGNPRATTMRNLVERPARKPSKASGTTRTSNWASD